MAKNSRDYWKQREEENLKHYLLEEENYTKRLHEILDYTADQIQRQIDGFYSKYAKKEGITLAEAKRRVKQVDIDEYSRKAKKYVAEKNFSKQANDEMRLYNATMKINRLELLKANIGLELTAGFDDLQKQLEEDLTSRATEELKRQAGILGETVLNNEKTAKAIVNASFRNATYSERIWMYQGMMKSELDKLLRQGLIQGQNPRQLATHLQKLFGTSKYNAERLMRTELARVQIEAQKQSFERNGYEEYIFLALGTACEVCRELDEKHFKVKDMVPGENAPPMHPNCRCSTAAWMNELGVMRQDAAIPQERNEKISEEGKNSFKNGSKNDIILLGAESTGVAKKVTFDSTKGYKINLPNCSEKINEVLSRASRNVAELGSKTGWEHAQLVDLKTGDASNITTDELPNSVRPDYNFLREHNNVAFVHNHNEATELSLPDVGEVVNNKEINAIIAMRNDGVATAIISNGIKMPDYLPLRYDDSGDRKKIIEEMINTKGTIDAIELEKKLLELAISEFSEGGILRYE